MNLGIILQARLGSKRLPNKSIKLINGKSLLDRCLENMLRVEISPLVTLLATTQLVEDDLLVSISNKKKVESFRGKNLNVLHRYYDAMETHKLDIVARLTGDNPVIDSNFLNFGLNLASTLRENTPFLISSRGTGLAAGLDIEIFNLEALALIRESQNPLAQEHVTYGLYPDKRVLKKKVTGRQLHPEFTRLTVDYQLDLEVASAYATIYDNELRSVQDLQVL